MVKSAFPGHCGHLDFNMTPGTMITFELKNKRREPIYGAYVQTKIDGGAPFGQAGESFRDELGNIHEIWPPRTRSDKYGKVALTLKTIANILNAGLEQLDINKLSFGSTLTNLHR